MAGPLRKELFFVASLRVFSFFTIIVIQGRKVVIKIRKAGSIKGPKNLLLYRLYRYNIRSYAVENLIMWMTFPDAEIFLTI